MKDFNVWKWMSCCILLLLFSTYSIAEELTPQQMVEKADRFRGYESRNFTLKTEVTFMAPKKKNRSNRLSVSVKENDSLVKFEAPARDKGKAMLFKNRELWFHAPKTKRLIRIAPIQRLLGGASNGDVANTRFSSDYNPELTGKESVDGIPCYVLNLKAVDRKVTYARLKYWVSEKDYRPVKSEHYAISGKLLKIARYEKFIEVNDDSYPKISQFTITNPIKPGEKTIMRYSQWKKANLSSSMFQKTYLKRLR